MVKERREPTPGAAVMIFRILDLMYIQMLRLNRAFARHHGRSPGQWRHEHVTR